MPERRPVLDREKRRPVPDRESGVKTDQPPLTAAEAGRYALQQIVDLTGKDPEGVTAVEPTEDGWLVTVEVIEDRRIPSSTDLLAAYEAELGPDGDLVSYRRVRRYARGWGDG
jgi:Gas vesicle synthesis protein GvpO